MSEQQKKKRKMGRVIGSFLLSFFFTLTPDYSFAFDEELCQREINVPFFSIEIRMSGYVCIYGAST